MPDPISGLLSAYPADIQEWAHELRKIVLATLPDAQETVDVADKVIGYGYGPGYGDMICTIILSQKTVSLGISHSASLPDPERILEGSGKVHRRIIFRSKDDLNRQGIDTLLLAAVQAWRQRRAE